MDDNDKELKGLGGWLILVGIGTVIAPVRILAWAIPTYKPIFEDGTWELLTTVDSPIYHVMWGPMLIGEIAFNAIMVVACIYLIYLYFSKHYLFPKVFIALMVVSLVFIPLDAWLVTFVLPDEPMFDPDTTKEFGRTVIASLIWIPYMLVSKRVKATFVEKRPDRADDPGVELAT